MLCIGVAVGRAFARTRNYQMQGNDGKWSDEHYQFLLYLFCCLWIIFWVSLKLHCRSTNSSLKHSHGSNCVHDSLSSLTIPPLRSQLHSLNHNCDG
ncbi:hypothetical protein RJ641_020036 [Dillenia turbinata]|uniref:Uncharacterized protein n=1 Tax=Dillenia turbinata TaxID=194707 RepID=A0AAN8UJ08_9MAGN